MRIIIIILSLSLPHCISDNFSEMTIRRNHSISNLGRLIISFKDKDIRYLRKMQLRLSKLQPNPKEKIVLSISPVLPFLIIPFTQKYDQIVPATAEFFAEGYMENQREYAFDIQQGVYYASFGNTFIDYKSNDLHYFNDEIPQNIFSQFERKNIEDCYPTTFFDAGILVGGKVWLCGAINIKEGLETRIEIIGDEKKVNYLKTFIIWIPGLLFFAPYFWGETQYDKSFKIHVITMNAMIE